MIPIALLHPVFGQFINNCQNHTPTMDNNKLVLSLSRAMSKFYINEYARAAKFQEILMEHSIMLVASEIEGSQCKTDGDLRWKGLCYIILEAKNELGGGGAEPLFEAMLYYLKSMRKQSEEDAHARLPSLIIYLSGAPLNLSYHAKTKMCQRSPHRVCWRSLHRWPQRRGAFRYAPSLCTWNWCRAEDFSSTSFRCAQESFLLIIAMLQSEIIWKLTLSTRRMISIQIFLHSTSHFHGMLLRVLVANIGLTGFLSQDGE